MKLLNSRAPSALTPHISLQALILDWAGTTVDFGSLAPVRTLQQVFESFDIHVSEEQARRDMGLPKRDHISCILSIPEVNEAWRRRYGNAPDVESVDTVYAQFIPVQLACLAEYSSVIPGVVQAVDLARAHGLKIGTTTGYTREMLDLLVAQAATQGYRPDCSLSPEDVGSGRPHPFMIFEAAVRLKVYPLAAIVKIGDTPSDIKEGLNAGVWSVGVARTGNMIGRSQSELEAISAAEQERLLNDARCQLENAGAHFVIDSVAEIDTVLNEIDQLLRGRAAHE
jgi:phosphonoacetaldehyde hydrolase